MPYEPNPVVPSRPAGGGGGGGLGPDTVGADEIIDGSITLADLASSVSDLLTQTVFTVHGGVDLLSFNTTIGMPFPDVLGGIAPMPDGFTVFVSYDADYPDNFGIWQIGGGGTTATKVANQPDPDGGSIITAGALVLEDIDYTYSPVFLYRKGDPDGEAPTDVPDGYRNILYRSDASVQAVNALDAEVNALNGVARATPFFHGDDAGHTIVAAAATEPTGVASAWPTEVDGIDVSGGGTFLATRETDPEDNGLWFLNADLEPVQMGLQWSASRIIQVEGATHGGGSDGTTENGGWWLLLSGEGGQFAYRVDQYQVKIAFEWDGASDPALEAVAQGTTLEPGEMFLALTAGANDFQVGMRGYMGAISQWSDPTYREVLGDEVLVTAGTYAGQRFKCTVGPPHRQFELIANPTAWAWDAGASEYVRNPNMDLVVGPEDPDVEGPMTIDDGDLWQDTTEV